MPADNSTWEYSILVAFPAINVKGIIRIRDGLAMLQLDDPRRTRELCDAEAAAGKRVRYDKAYRAMFEYYDDLNAIEIKNKIEVELKKAGGNLQDIK